VGFRLFYEDIPVTDPIRKICAHFGINYLRLISSGSMLIIIHPDKAAQLERAVGEVGVSLSRIGEVLSREAGRNLTFADGKEETIQPPGSDELYKVIK
jgi:hydrogenase expression/formation protein HypE